MLPAQSQLLAGGQRRAALHCRPFQPCSGGLHLLRRNRGGLAQASPATAVAPQASTSAPAEAASPAAAHSAADMPAFKAHLDFKFIRDNVDLVAANCKSRLSNADPRRVADLYDQYVKLKTEADQLRAERNENANAMKVCTCVPG